MTKKSQLGKWLVVFFLMGFFTFFQLPISEYALGIVQPSSTLTQSSDESAVTAAQEEVIEQRAEEDSREDSREEDSGKEDSREEDNQKEDNGEQNVVEDNLRRINNTADDDLEKEGEKKPVYLTIDDGPGTVSDKILDVLDHYEVSATFFLVEPRVRYYSDAVIRMVEEGHELGVHGVTHDVRRFYASQHSAVGEFNKTRASLQTLTGKEYYLARTPYGSFPYLTQAQERAIIDGGYRIWDWNVDSRDWYYRGERYVTSTIAQLQNLEHKGIVPIILIHELETTARYLPLLIEYLLANDYELKTLSMEDRPVRLR